MKKLIDLKKVCLLDKLIRTQATGNHEELAKKLGVSRSSMYELISYLREEMNAPIIFDTHQDRYVYAYPPRFHLDPETIEIMFPVDGEVDISKNGNCYEVRDFDLGKSDMEDEEVLVPAESEIAYGGNEDDWNTCSLDDDSENVILYGPIIFNDLYID